MLYEYGEASQGAKTLWLKGARVGSTGRRAEGFRAWVLEDEEPLPVAPIIYSLVVSTL